MLPVDVILKRLLSWNLGMKLSLITEATSGIQRHCPGDLYVDAIPAFMVDDV